jgi:uncharacterized RDD family membrane protein YckC
VKCPSCGYVSFDRLAACKRCGAALGAGAPETVAPPDPFAEFTLEDTAPLEPEPEPEPALAAEAAPGGLFDLAETAPTAPPRGSAADAIVEETAAAVEFVEDENLPQVDQEEPSAVFFSLDAEVDPGLPPGETVFPWGAIEGPAPPREAEPPPETGARPRRAPEPATPAPPADAEQPGADADPIIDQDEEVPESFWVQEGAPLGRRAAAAAVDQAIIAAVLGLFVCGAVLVLRGPGLDPAAIAGPPGLRAALVPYGLLALLINLGYFTFFHGWAGRTPGKGLAGLEVRARDGNPPTYGRAVLRWLAAAAGVAAAGVGVAWALFEPRRLGWADLLSGTVITERRR